MGLIFELTDTKEPHPDDTEATEVRLNMQCLLSILKSGMLNMPTFELRPQGSQCNIYGTAPPIPLLYSRSDSKK